MVSPSTASLFAHLRGCGLTARGRVTHLTAYGPPSLFLLGALIPTAFTGRFGVPWNLHPVNDPRNLHSIALLLDIRRPYQPARASGFKLRALLRDAAAGSDDRNLNREQMLHAFFLLSCLSFEPDSGCHKLAITEKC